MRATKIEIRNSLAQIEARIEKLSIAPIRSLSSEKKDIADWLARVTITAKENEITCFNGRIDRLKKKNFKLMGL